jgi:two-component system response regulator HydG
MSADVLVIDDEPVVREAVRRILEKEGLRVLGAEDGASGLAHPAAGTCRLALCDLMLPDLAGMEVLKALRARRPDLPIVMITGFATPDHALRARDAGATDFLAKPFEARELLEVVRRALSLEAVGRKGGGS